MYVENIDFAPPSNADLDLAGVIARAKATAYLLDRREAVTPETVQRTADAHFFAPALREARTINNEADIREAERLSPGALLQQSPFLRYALGLSARFLAAVSLNNLLRASHGSIDNRTNSNLSGKYDDSLRSRDREDFKEPVSIIPAFVVSNYNNFGYSSSLLTLFAAAKSQVFNPLQSALSSAVTMVSNFRDAAVEAGDHVRKWIGDTVENVLRRLPLARSLVEKNLESFRDAGRQLSSDVREILNEGSSHVSALLKELRTAGSAVFTPDLMRSRPTLPSPVLRARIGMSPN